MHIWLVIDRYIHIHYGQITSVLLIHGPINAFLVPDSCRVTERNGISLSADVTDATIEND
jgi:hypothetical protein